MEVFFFTQPAGHLLELRRLRDLLREAFLFALRRLRDVFRLRDVLRLALRRLRDVLREALRLREDLRDFLTRNPICEFPVILALSSARLSAS